MVTRTHNAVSQVLGWARRVRALAPLLVFGCVIAKGQDTHVVNIPLTFHSEIQDIATKACLAVKEHGYPAQSNWWEDTAGAASASERTFKGVISAIKHKDRATLLRLSDTKEAQDTKRFDEQAGAFFQQFENLEIVSVPRSYDFDGVAVFYVKLRTASTRVFSVPFVFALQGDGAYRFLPSRTRKVTYELVNDWFQSPWGPAASEKAAYCSEEDIKQATHRVELASPNETTAFTSHLSLTGAPFDAPGDLAGLVSRVKATIEQMRSALAAGKLDEFVGHMTPEGGNRLKQWFVGADEAELARYKSTFTQQQPFFVFDESPLLVVYTRTTDGTVQVMYFTSQAGNQLLWTNSSHVTVADQVFKKGPFYKTASLTKPFSSIAIK